MTLPFIPTYPLPFSAFSEPWEASFYRLHHQPPCWLLLTGSLHREEPVDREGGRRGRSGISFLTPPCFLAEVNPLGGAEEHSL